MLIALCILWPVALAYALWKAFASPRSKEYDETWPEETE